jgi:DNA polymerase-1
MPNNRQQTFDFGESSDPRRASKEAQAASAQPWVGQNGMAESAASASFAPEPLNPSPSPPDSLAGETVYVVDAHSLIFQVFHAVGEMTGPSGQPVNAVFGFTRDILDLLEQKQPHYLFCAFDLPGPTFRHARYENYKIDRAEMPEDLRPQIPAIMRLMEAMRIPVLTHRSFEADDILATVARRVEELGGECVLVTSDKDCRQLITDNTRLYNIRKTSYYDAKSLQADWGIRPDQVVDFQALVGDATDNVPGIELIGPKTARDLLATYDTLEGVLDHADEIAGKKRKQNLIDGRDIAMLSRELVKLVDDVPVEVDWIAGRVGEFDNEAVLEHFREFGFRQFANRLSNVKASEAPKRWEATYELVSTRRRFAEWVELLSTAEQISFDTETTHRSPRWAELVGLSFAIAEGKAFYVPVRAPAGDPCLDLEFVLASLKPVLENAAVAKIGQNLKYDALVLRNYGIHVAGLSFDTMIADYLLEAGGRNHSLDDLADRYLNHKPTKITELIGAGKNQKRMDEVPVALVSDYAAEDADVPMRLRPLLGHRLKEERLDDLFTSLELPLIDVLVEMEFNGMMIDTRRLADLSEDYGRRMETLQTEIHEIAGREFNIASPKQLAQVLFTELELPVVKKTKTGPSTDAEVLAELARLHDLPAKIVDYRKYAKLKGTYIDALPALVCPATGRVHTSLNQVVAATGRLSSNDPNLQNIPIRTEEGREIRSAFVPGKPGWRLLAADYSQIELRVLAHYSQDEALIAAFTNDEDIHARVAGQIHKVSLDRVTSDMRRGAKAINFGVIYGQSPFGLAKALDIPQEQAAEFIDTYFAQYPGVEAFMDNLLNECREQGYVSTMLGRRRTIQGVRKSQDRAKNPRSRTMPERTAINTVIQGSAADIIKLAMIAVYGRLTREKCQARLLLQIHDELLFEAPADEIDWLTDLARDEMAAATDLQAPLKVDVKTGPNWADCE